jgi:hypothetical protein
LAGFSITEPYPGSKKLEEFEKEIENLSDDKKAAAQEEAKNEKELFDKREDIIKLREARLEYLRNEQDYAK